MLNTFNLGVGFVVIVEEKIADSVIKHFGKYVLDAKVIGKVIKGDQNIKFN